MEGLTCSQEDLIKEQLYNSLRQRVKIHSSSSEFNYILNDIKDSS